MIWHRRSPFALALLAASVAAGLLFAGRAVAPPAVPPGPALPDFSKIPGARVAHFKVIVEGTATAAKDEDWASETPCTVSINAHVVETTTYRRGKGVVMEFVQLRKGGPVIVQRKGRSYDASLALTTTTTRTSSGTATRTDPPNGAGVCAPLTEDLSQGPDCGKPQVDTAKAGLVYTGGLLSIQLRGLSPLPETRLPEERGARRHRRPVLRVADSAATAPLPRGRHDDLREDAEGDRREPHHGRQAEGPADGHHRQPARDGQRVRQQHAHRPDDPSPLRRHPASR